MGCIVGGPQATRQVATNRYMVRFIGRSLALSLTAVCGLSKGATSRSADSFPAFIGLERLPILFV